MLYLACLEHPEGLPGTAESRSPNQQGAGGCFAACRDEAGIEKTGARPLEQGFGESATAKLLRR